VANGVSYDSAAVLVNVKPTAKATVLATQPIRWTPDSRALELMGGRVNPAGRHSER